MENQFEAEKIITALQTMNKFNPVLT